MEPINLLIIDDDPNILRLLTELFSGKLGYRLLVASDGKEAVRCFIEDRVDVVLTDIHMPNVTGIELMADMQKVKFRPEILVMTANATPENVEKSKKIGARSIILKPFDDLSVVEEEVARAVEAIRQGRAKKSAGAAAAPPAKPAPATAPRPAPVATAPPAAAPVPPPRLGGRRADAPPVPVAVEVAGDWQSEVTGNQMPDAASPTATVRLDSAGFGTPSAPPPAPPAGAEAGPDMEAGLIVEVAEPPEAEAVVVDDPAAFFSDLKEDDPGPARPAAPPPAPSAEQAQPMPPDLEDIFRIEASLDVGRMKMQVPVICLQTLEEKAAIKALYQMAASAQRDFYTWSAARGLLKDNEQPMGEMYREPLRALEFIRRQKSRGLYLMADFRACLEDRTIVRTLREMVMEQETAHGMLVLTSPRLVLPPELSAACVVFDWPAATGNDLTALFEEVRAEVQAATHVALQVEPASRDALLARTRGMPAGRARFEMARALMALVKKAS
jgi:CheY-like chemotaxis protein